MWSIIKNWTFGWWHIPMAFTICYFITTIQSFVCFFTAWMFPWHLKKIQPKKTVANVTHLFVDKGKSCLWMNAWVRHFSACGFLFAAITCHEKPSHSFGQHPAQKNKSHTCDFRFPTAKNFWLLSKENDFALTGWIMRLWRKCNYFFVLSHS